MSAKWVIALFSLIALPVVVYLWPTDESRIRKLVKEGAIAVGKEDIDGLMSKVSFGYRDEYGLSYALLKDIIKSEFGFYSDIVVEYDDVKVEVNGDEAVCEMTLRVLASAGSERGYIFGDLKEPVRLRLELEKDAMKRWLVAGSSGLKRYKGGVL